MGSEAGSAEPFEGPAGGSAEDRERRDTEAVESPRLGSGSSSPLSSIASVLDEVEDALGRLEHGSYGLCEVCGGRIEVAVLEPSPTARRCAAHAPRPSVGSSAVSGTNSGMTSGRERATEVEAGGEPAVTGDRARDLGSEQLPGSRRDSRLEPSEDLRDEPATGFSVSSLRAGRASDEGGW